MEASSGFQLDEEYPYKNFEAQVIPIYPKISYLSQDIHHIPKKNKLGQSSDWDISNWITEKQEIFSSSVHPRYLLLGDGVTVAY